MRMTIGSVMDDINEWEGRNGIVYYVTAFFTNKEVLSVGKKDMDAALEVKGLLQEVIEVPQEFILEPKGQTKKGAAKWNLKAFGPPEGVWTYSTIKGGQPEVGAGEGERGSSPVESSVAPSHGSDTTRTGVGISAPFPTNNVDASIRASVALKAAACMCNDQTPAETTILLAEKFDEWLAKKSSGVTPQGSPEDKAPAVPDGSRDQTGEGVGTGEGPAPSSTHWQERVKDWPDPSENPL